MQARALCPHSLLVGCVTWWVERERSGKPLLPFPHAPTQQPTRQIEPGGKSPGNGITKTWNEGNQFKVKVEVSMKGRYLESPWTVTAEFPLFPHSADQD